MQTPGGAADTLAAHRTSSTRMVLVELRNLRVIGVVTWAIVGVPAILWELQRGSLASTRAATWITAYLLFALLFWVASRPGTSATRKWTIVALQTLCWSVCVALNPSGFLAVLLVIVAAQVGSEPLSHAFGWIVFQTLVQMTILAQVLHDQPVSTAMAYFGFQLFAQYAARVAFSEAEARRELAVAHAELQLTSGLLEINSRSEERLRIARELHDLLGHHLTALSLHLEVATHLTSGAAREHVEKSHALTRVLLSDVREVVSQVREREPVDLVHAVRVLAAAVSIPRIHTDLPTSINVGDPLARTALRTLQEIVTNAVRHSSARNLWLRLAHRNGLLQIEGRDDGQGTDLIRYGNGLKGMKERAEEAGGRFEVESRRGHGFSIRVSLPSEVGA